jgi:GntR family transcriptional regulator/MocR family aminotransferase
LLDLTANGPAGFPFSVWNQLQRQVMRSHGRELLHSLPNQGLLPLRRAIAKHLADFRGMRVDPESIVMGAGTDFLYNLLIQLLGRDQIYAVEEPGYEKIRRIYAAGGVRCVSAVMDGAGVMPESLGDAHVLHISPSHHFPTGLVTPIQRRQALLCWAGFAFAVVIMFTRMVLGAHYLSDVSAGALLGLALVFLNDALQRRIGSSAQ